MPAIFNSFLMEKYFEAGLVHSNNGNKNHAVLVIKPLFNDAFFKFLILENRILNYVNLPFGISLFAVARKKRLQENE